MILFIKLYLILIELKKKKTNIKGCTKIAFCNIIKKVRILFEIIFKIQCYLME